jgi:hypothetical protein
MLSLSSVVAFERDGIGIHVALGGAFSRSVALSRRQKDHINSVPVGAIAATLKGGRRGVGIAKELIESMRQAAAHSRGRKVLFCALRRDPDHS